MMSAKMIGFALLAGMSLLGGKAKAGPHDPVLVGKCQVTIQGQPSDTVGFMLYDRKVIGGGAHYRFKFTDRQGEKKSVQLVTRFGSSDRKLFAVWLDGDHKYPVEGEQYSVLAVISEVEAALVPGVPFRLAIGAKRGNPNPEIALTCEVAADAPPYTDEPEDGCDGGDPCDGGGSSASN